MHYTRSPPLLYMKQIKDIIVNGEAIGRGYDVDRSYSLKTYQSLTDPVLGKREPCTVHELFFNGVSRGYIALKQDGTGYDSHFEHPQHAPILNQLIEASK